MNAWLARIAKELMITPSTSVCGLAIISGMSLQVPGSDSSALTTRYFGFGLSCGMKPHFMPVGKPAPPRPRRPESLTASMTSSGRHAERLAQRGVPALVLVGRQRPGSVGVPVVGEDRGQRVGAFGRHSSPSARSGVVLVLGAGRGVRDLRLGLGAPVSACWPSLRALSLRRPAVLALATACSARARSSRARGRARGRPARPARRTGPRRRGRRGSRPAPARPRARCTAAGRGWR